MDFDDDSQTPAAPDLDTERQPGSDVKIEIHPLPDETRSAPAWMYWIVGLGLLAAFLWGN